EVPQMRRETEILVEIAQPFLQRNGTGQAAHAGQPTLFGREGIGLVATLRELLLQQPAEPKHAFLPIDAVVADQDDLHEGTVSSEGALSAPSARPATNTVKPR